MRSVLLYLVLTSKAAWTRHLRQASCLHAFDCFAVHTYHFNQLQHTRVYCITFRKKTTVQCTSISYSLSLSLEYHLCLRHKYRPPITRELNPSSPHKLHEYAGANLGAGSRVRFRRLRADGRAVDQYGAPKAARVLQ